MDEEQKPTTTLALPSGKLVSEFGNLTLRQKQGLALVENRQRLALAADVAARQIRLQSSAVDMDQTIQRVQDLSRSTRADFTVRSTHTTASGETTISVNRNNNLMIILAVAAVLLLLFLLR